MAKRSFLLCGVLVGTLAAAPLTAQGSHPESLIVDGIDLPVVAQARRAQLLGSVDLYDVAIYAAGPLRDSTTLAPRTVAKAVRVAITFKPDLQSAMSFNWQPELIPALEPDAVAQMRRILMPLRYGDVLQIDYAPERGTTVRVNRDVAVSRASHQLMLAYLDHWIGQRPLSEELKQALLR
jgi:hypothetical protein